MPFWRLYYHLVWSTKNRQPLIQPEFEHTLFAQMITKASQMECHIYAINAWYDHVHILIAIPPKHSVAEVVKNLKGASSHYLNHGTDTQAAPRFAWQRGYGALSLGERQLPIAEEYIGRQKVHHGQQSCNAWLERDDDYDEGPISDTAAQRAATGGAPMRESGEVYAVDPSPF